MASFAALLISVLVLVAGTQSAAVPSAMAVNPMGMASAGVSTGMGLANEGMGLANSAMDSSMALGNSALAAGQSTVGSISGRMIKEAKTFNENLQNALGAQINGGANMLNSALKMDAEIVEQTGVMLKELARLSGATSEQILKIVSDVMKGGPLATVEYIQKTLKYIADKKRQVGSGIVSRSNSFTQGMRQKSFAPLNMLENMNNLLLGANQYTSAMTGSPSAAASAAAAAAIAPSIP